MKIIRYPYFIALITVFYLDTATGARTISPHPPSLPAKVNLSPHIGVLEITTPTGTIIIRRKPDPLQTIPPPFDKTSRPCPPFCIQPISAGQGVQTIGELELFEYLQKGAKQNDILIIDSRLAEWYLRETIPLAINIPEELLMNGYDNIVQTDLGATKTEKGWDYTNARTLVIFCNGYWNPDSYQTIQFLLSKDYPAEKIKWYRGGMQAWLSLGLTTVKNPQ